MSRWTPAWWRVASPAPIRASHMTWKRRRDDVPTWSTRDSPRSEQRGDRGPTILAEPAVENQSRVDRTELWRRTGVANAFKEIPRQHRPAVSGRDPALFQMQEGDRVKIGRQFRTSLADGRSTGRHE